MSINQNVLGLIFASINDSAVVDLTKLRTMGSIPYGGRYRTVDFPLSNMVNSGISEVGVITKSNYGSLLDHLGSGREWDLARKKGGLHLLPPFSQSNGGIYQDRLEALCNIWSFLVHTRADYVIMADCDIITTINFTDALQQHIDSGADVTIIYAKEIYNREKRPNGCILQMDPENTIREILVSPQMSGECNMSLDMFIWNTDFLQQVIAEAISKNQRSLVRDVLQSKKDTNLFKGYEHKGKFFKIDSLDAYYKANLALLDSDTRNSIFVSDAPIYTKVGDNAPVKYGLESSVKNSLIADGCMIEGTVENSVLFRGVKIGKDTVVRNSVVMQGSVIGSGCALDAIVADKNVTISDNRVLTGSTDYPLYLEKRAKI